MGTSRATTETRKGLERMARVLVSALRVKIMTALSVRPMSPKMIQDWLGDDEYEVSTIDKNLKQLKRYGWVELADTRTRGARRGATEHVYRAIRLPIFDDVIWPALPIAMREMVTWGIFEGLIRCMNEIWDADRLDARDGRHLTCTAGFVDRVGWDRIVARVNDLFYFSLEEAQSAAPRLAESGEEPIAAMVALACFESPPGRLPPDRNRDRLLEASAALSKHALSLRMAKAMSDLLRLLILDELSTRAMSAKMFFEEFGGRRVAELGGKEITKNEVYRAFRVLKKFDWLVRVEMRSRGAGPGGKEHLYRAVRPPIFDSTRWPVLPESMKDQPTWRAFGVSVDRMREAMEASTMDARDDRHFTWTPILFDRTGWDRTADRVGDLHDFVHDEVKSAGVRLEESGEQPIPVTALLAVIESSPPSPRGPGSPFI